VSLSPSPSLPPSYPACTRQGDKKRGVNECVCVTESGRREAKRARGGPGGGEGGRGGGWGGGERDSPQLTL